MYKVYYRCDQFQFDINYKAALLPLWYDRKELMTSAVCHEIKKLITQQSNGLLTMS